MGVIPTKLSQRIRFLRSKIFFSGLGIRVMTLNSFKVMLCFHNCFHNSFISTNGVTQLLAFIGSRLIAFDFRLVVWFPFSTVCAPFYSHLDFTYLLDILSDLLIFSAWLLNYSSVQVIGNSAHLFFYPVLTHTVMVWWYIPALTCLLLICFIFYLF